MCGKTIDQETPSFGDGVLGFGQLFLFCDTLIKKQMAAGMYVKSSLSLEDMENIAMDKKIQDEIAMRRLPEIQEKNKRFAKAQEKKPNKKRKRLSPIPERKKFCTLERHPPKEKKAKEKKAKKNEEEKEKLSTKIFRILQSGMPATTRSNPYAKAKWHDMMEFDNDTDIKFEDLVKNVASILLNTIVVIDGNSTVLKKCWNFAGPYWKSQAESSFTRAYSHHRLYSQNDGVSMIDVFNALKPQLCFASSVFCPIARKGKETPPVDCGMGPQAFNVFCCYSAQFHYEQLSIDERAISWESPAVGIFLYHIENVLANKDDRKFKYFMRWLTHMVQKPGVKTGHCPIVYGDSGTGKSVVTNFLVQYLFGPQHASIIMRDSDFASNWTGDISTIVFTVLEDLRGVISKDSGKLKNMITADTADIDRKFMEKEQVASFVNCMINSNNECPVAIEPTDRRFGAYLVSNAFVGDTAYHARMSQFFRGDPAVQAQSARELYAYLRNRPDPEFPIGEEFVTLELLKMKRASSGCVDNVVCWLKQMKQSNRCFLPKSQELLPKKQRVYPTQEQIYRYYLASPKPNRQRVLDGVQFHKRMVELFKRADITYKPKQTPTLVNGEIKNLRKYRITLEDIELVIHANDDASFSFAKKEAEEAEADEADEDSEVEGRVAC